jgi:hypothetical protein
MKTKFDSNIELRTMGGSDVPESGAIAIFAKDDHFWSTNSAGDQSTLPQ